MRFPIFVRPASHEADASEGDNRRQQQEKPIGARFVRIPHSAGEKARNSKRAKRELRDRDDPGNIAALQRVNTPKKALGVRAAISDSPNIFDDKRRSR